LPSLSGQMAEEITGLMSVVGYLAEFEEANDQDVMETHRTLLLKNFPKFRTKARSPWGVKIPDEIIDPTVTSLLDTLGYPIPEGNGAAPKASRRRSAASTREKKREEQPPEAEDDPRDYGQADPSGGDN